MKYPWINKGVIYRTADLVNEIPHYVKGFASSGFYFIRDDRYFPGVTGNEAARLEEIVLSGRIRFKRAASFPLLILRTVVIPNGVKAK